MREPNARHRTVRAAAPGLMLILALAALAPALRAGTLTLANGDQVAGTLVRADAKQIVFNANLMGNLNLQWKQIRTLNTSAALVVIPNRGRPVTGEISYSAGKLYILPPAGQEIIWPVTGINLILTTALYKHYIVQRPNLLQGWHGSIAGGFGFVSATQSSQSYTASVNLTRPIPDVNWLLPRSNTQFSLQETYGSLTQPATATEPALQVKTSVFTAALEQDQYFSRSLFVLAQAQLDHNFAQGLQLQQSYGPGIGWAAFRNFDLKMDLHLTIEQFLAAPRTTFLAASIAETYTRALGPLHWSESISAQPPITNGQATGNTFQANGTTTVSVPIYKRLGFNTTLTDSYLGNPQPGFRHNSLQFSTGLQINLP
ncbi:MAG: DUF481 domain-containing protein [Terriglobales bacterium]